MGSALGQRSKPGSPAGFLKKAIFLRRKIGYTGKITSTQVAFLRRKTMENRKLPTEAEILVQLRQGNLDLPPLTVEKVETVPGSRDRGFDALVTLGWQGKSYRFGAEIRRL